MADFSRANFIQSVSQGFFFSIGGNLITPVDPPSRESTDHGLIKGFIRFILFILAVVYILSTLHSEIDWQNYIYISVESLGQEI